MESAVGASSSDGVSGDVGQALWWPLSLNTSSLAAIAEDAIAVSGKKGKKKASKKAKQGDGGEGADQSAARFVEEVWWAKSVTYRA